MHFAVLFHFLCVCVLPTVLETQFSGDNIVLVFPDGSSPALLSAMMAGIPYNKAHVLEYAPGEIRLDVTRTSTLALYETKRRENASEYSALLQRGEKELKRLRSLDEESLVSKPSFSQSMADQSET